MKATLKTSIRAIIIAPDFFPLPDAGWTRRIKGLRVVRTKSLRKYPYHRVIKHYVQ